MGDVFDSANLNDAPSCPSGSPSVEYPRPCEALPSKLLIASNVGPEVTGSFSFSFNHASKLSTQAPVGSTAYGNTYP